MLLHVLIETLQTGVYNFELLFEHIGDMLRVEDFGKHPEVEKLLEVLGKLINEGLIEVEIVEESVVEDHWNFSRHNEVDEKGQVEVLKNLPLFLALLSYGGLRSLVSYH